MDRRKFLNSMSAATAATIAGAATLSEKADALEDAMSDAVELEGKRRSTPRMMCHLENGRPPRDPNDNRPFLMHDEPNLPKMPAKPTLVDFYKLRFNPASHVLQSAKLARDAGEDEKVVMACLLHDIWVGKLGSTDHGYWCAQMIAPYVSEEIAWSIEKHQALRFFADKNYGYEYPEAYIEYFGKDYRPEPYIVHAHEQAKKHKWYDTSRKITVNDLYSFEEGVQVAVEDFTDIIGRNFKQPKDGLGFDESKTAHMWRTFIWPNNYL
jgi:hypothetical protein